MSVTGGRRPGWLFLAAHGGAGVDLLARLSWQPYEAEVTAAQAEGRHPGPTPAFGMATTAWPNPNVEVTNAVVVVCQTTMRGLGWARDLAAQYLSGRVPPGLHLTGLVTVADQPGRLPPPLTAARNLLEGAYPRLWRVPYVPEYRLLTGLPDEPCPAIHPAIEAVLAEIRASLEVPVLEGTPA